MLCYMIGAFLCVLPLSSLSASISEIRGELYSYAEEAQLDRLLILRNGRSFYSHANEASAEPLYDLGEMSRPIVAIAFLLLLEEGKIPYLQMPLSSFEWGDNCLSTPGPAIMHLLRGCTGGAGESECNWRPFLALFEKLAEQSLPDYLKRKLFAPLQINTVFWHFDEGGRTAPRISIAATDLAKISTLLLNGGLWQGKKILSTRAIEMMWSPTHENDPFAGLFWSLQYLNCSFWWDQSLLALYSAHRLSNSLICRLSALQGRVVHFSGIIENGEQFFVWGNDTVDLLGGECGLRQLAAETSRCKLPLARFTPGSLRAVLSRDGWSQEWIIMPRHRLAAIALRKGGSSSFKRPARSLLPLLTALAYECDSYID